MRRLLGTAVLLCAIGIALRDTAPALGQNSHAPHPAVARISVAERGATSYGSGVLVGVDETLGLVVTNWHVVRDAAGPITVQFPDGFRSTANVLAVDRDCDLAALAIRRPNVSPIALAANAPQQGEILTIAGYGSGDYRAAKGRRTPYASPDGNLVEVSTPARQGDSGGPILNERGELAGVLFGTGFDGTIGSHCGRVRTFLGDTADDFQRLSSQSAQMIALRTQESNPPAYRPPAEEPPRESVAVATLRGGPRRLPHTSPGGNASSLGGNASSPRSQTMPLSPLGPSSPLSPPSSSWDIAVESPGPRSAMPREETAPIAAHIASAGSGGSSSGVSATPATATPQPDGSRSWEADYPRTPWADAAPIVQPPESPPAAPTRTDQIKTILAAIGVLAILFHGLRLLGAMV